MAAQTGIEATSTNTVEAPPARAVRPLIGFVEV